MRSLEPKHILGIQDFGVIRFATCV